MAADPDRLVERPPLIVYNGDIDRLRRFGMDNGCGDSAVALRKALDVAESVTGQRDHQHVRAMSAEFVLAMIAKGIRFRGEADPVKIARKYLGDKLS